MKYQILRNINYSSSIQVFRCGAAAQILFSSCSISVLTKTFLTYNPEDNASEILGQTVNSASKKFLIKS